MEQPENILFPPEKRRFKGGRFARITLRTLHLLSFSILFGGHVFGLPRAELSLWLYWTVLSGACLMALELWPGFDWLLQGAGCLVLVKLVILAFIPAVWEYRIALLTLVMIIGSIGSHMPSSLRHSRVLPLRRNPPAAPAP
jgi:hypothetical protein